MILAVDVYYRQKLAVVGGVSFPDWSSRIESAAYRSVLECAEAYVPGEFFRRELPCILCLLKEHALVPDIIVVDGLVYLDGFCTPGLGKHLFDALDGRSAVIGVAKSGFASAPEEIKVYRGKSRRPLYVTSVGMALAAAKDCIVSMHGRYRIPTLLKRADQVSRMAG